MLCKETVVTVSTGVHLYHKMIKTLIHSLRGYYFAPPKGHINTLQRICQ